MLSLGVHSCVSRESETNSPQSNFVQFVFIDGGNGKTCFFCKTKYSIDEIVVLCHNRRCQQYDCFSLPCFHEFQAPCCECLVAGGMLSTGPSRQRGTVSLSPLPVVRHRTAKAANDFKVWSSPSCCCNLVMFAIFLQMRRTKSTL